MISSAAGLTTATGAWPGLQEPLLESKAKGRYTVSMNYANRITFDPEQCGGRPCVRHYRIRVKNVLDMMAAGVSEAEILKDYAFLEPEDIRACLEFAAEQVELSGFGKRLRVCASSLTRNCPPPWRWLREKGHQAEHVLDVNLAQSKDTPIWHCAQDLGAVMVTKDEAAESVRRRHPAVPRLRWCGCPRRLVRTSICSFVWLEQALLSEISLLRNLNSETVWLTAR